jgi:hypothetical protein
MLGDAIFYPPNTIDIAIDFPVDTTGEPFAVIVVAVMFVAFNVFEPVLNVRLAEAANPPLVLNCT